MDKLQLLNNILIEPELSFNSISERITNKTNINLAKDILINMDFDNLIEYRSFLSIWIIKYCKNDIFEDEKINEYDTLIAICEKIIDNINSGINKDDIITFDTEFKRYKEKDKNDLMNDIFFKYYTLTIEENLINPDEVDKREIISECKKNLLITAKQLGGQTFIDQIKSGNLIALDSENILEKYNKAFWDIVNECYINDMNKFYTYMYEILFLIKDLLNVIGPSKINIINEVLDINYIKQRVEHNAYTIGEIIVLINNIIDIIKSLQSPIRDQELESFRSQVNKDELILPIILKTLVLYCNNIVDDIMKLNK
jgi:hypothetical protein